MRPPLDPRASEPGGARRGWDAIDGPGARPAPPPVLAGSAGTPAWLGWLQVGMSSMLAVLFVVTLVRSREQNQELQRVRQRLKALESSRSIDRSAAQDEQLRAVVQRLQTIEEQQAQRLQIAERERLRIEQQLLDLNNRPRIARTAPPPDASEESTPAAPPPRLSPSPRFQRGAPPIGTGVMPLRPPPELR
jgi:hypothetical protein